MWDLFDFHGFFHVKTIFIFNFFSKAPEIRALVMKYLVIYLRPETHPGLNCETITLKVKISYKFWNVNVLWIISTYWAIYIFQSKCLYHVKISEATRCSELWLYKQKYHYHNEVMDGGLWVSYTHLLQSFF